VSISRYCGLLAPLFTVVLAATPAHEEPSAPRDLEHNRQLLQKWQTDPEHYARLQRDLRDFWALSKPNRERLRQFDRELHDLDASSQKRLWKVAERYRAWLERLPEEDRRKIEAATDLANRLRLVKEIREGQWLERLPRKVSEQLEKLPADERALRVERLREQERKQRKLWERPLGPGPRPAKPRTQLQELPEVVQAFWTKNVLPRLSAEERSEYERAKSRGEFVPTLKRLAEQHPVLPPLPPPAKPVRRYEDLSDDAKRIAGAKPLWERRTDTWKRLQKVEGVWPEWAELFLGALTPEQRKALPSLGASRPREFPPNIQKFIDTTLRNKLRHPEWRKLRETEGRWPEYPKRLLELAHKHNLEVPDMSLPGSIEGWDVTR
jgi:hypothetical protein